MLKNNQFCNLFKKSSYDKEILNLAIPNIISNISVPLLGLADVIVMGHLGSSIYLGAIAIGTMIFNFIFWTFGFLRMGTSGFTAQSYGALNFPEAIHHLYRGLFIGIIAGILLILLQWPISYIAFNSLDASTAVESIARDYFDIRIYTAPATIALYAFMGWFIGMQNTRIPMFITLFVNILNIGLNILFVYQFNLNVKGIAYGGIISQYSGLMLAFIFLKTKYSNLSKLINYTQIINRKALIMFMNVNRDIFIRTILLIFAFSFFTAQSAKYGDNILAINTLLYQFFIFFSYAMDGFAYAAEAIAGKYFGAKNSTELKNSVTRLFHWGIAMSLIFSLIYFLFNNQILQFLTNQKSIIAQAQSYSLFIITLPVLSFMAFLWDGVYVGCTASKEMRNSMIIAVLIVYFPTALLLQPKMGNNGLWIAFLFFLATRGIMLAIFYKRGIMNKIRER